MLRHSVVRVYKRLHNRVSTYLVTKRRPAGSLTLFFRHSSTVSIMDNKRVDVYVREGRLIGIVEETIHGVHYVAFRGIPYAKSPIGELRFKVNSIPSP